MRVSLLRNLLSGTGVIGADDGVIRAGDGIKKDGIFNAATESVL